MSWGEAAARSALVLVVSLPLLAALVVATVRRPGLGRSLGPAVAAATVVLALVVAVASLDAGAVSVVTGGAGGTAGAGLAADRLGAVLLLLTCGVGAVAQGFARRYLRGDEGADRFFAAAALLTGSTAAMVTAATLVGLAVAWTVAGIALCLLLVTHRSPAARAGARRTARAFLVGDVALWAAVIGITVVWGDLDLRRPLPADLPAAAPAVVVGAACLIVVAALARSAQVPFHGWVPVTLAVPTPVSALLHAGVVNAGGILLVRTGGLVGAVPLATHLAFAAGALTAVWGTVLMLTRPDVKGALAHSTVGQMGFMIMSCGLGWYAAAVVHLVAHGMYKATLFLGSGSAVERGVRALRAAPRPVLGRSRRFATTGFAVVVPAAVLAVTAALLPAQATGKPGTAALLVLAWATAAWTVRGFLRRRATAAGALTALVALVVLLPAYVLVVDVVSAFLAPSLPAPGPAAVSPWLLAVVAVAAAGPTALRLLPGHPRLVELHRTLYVRALVEAHHPGAAPPRAPAGPRSRPARPALVPSPEGARP